MFWKLRRERKVLSNTSNVYSVMNLELLEKKCQAEGFESGKRDERRREEREKRGGTRMLTDGGLFKLPGGCF